MTFRRSAGLAAASCAAVVLSTLALSGCGDSGENAPIEQNESVTEKSKDSMDYMQQKYAKKK